MEKKVTIYKSTHGWAEDEIICFDYHNHGAEPTYYLWELKNDESVKANFLGRMEEAKAHGFDIGFHRFDLKEIENG